MLSGSEQKAYNDLLAQVSKLENELMQCKLYVKANGSDILPQRTRQDALATVQRSLHKIVPLCIQALELCDEDINLHRKLYCYSQLIDA